MNAVKGCAEKLKTTCHAFIDEKKVAHYCTLGVKVKWLTEDE